MTTELYQSECYRCAATATSETKDFRCVCGAAWRVEWPCVAEVVDGWQKLKNCLVFDPKFAKSAKSIP